MPYNQVKVWKNGAWREVWAVNQRQGSSWRKMNMWQRQGSTWRPLIDYTPDTAQFTTTWRSTAVATYNGSGNRYDTSVASQGYYSSTHGERTAIIAFDHADIRSKIPRSATINDVKLELTANSTYWNAGGTFVIGTTSVGGTPSDYSIRSFRLGWQQMQAGDRVEFNLNDAVGEQFRDDLARGLVLDARSTDREYYVSANNSFDLKIVYTKPV